MRHSRHLLGLAGALSALALAAGPAAAAPAHRDGPKRGFGRGTSTNWSGYAVDGTGATSVTGSWTQASVKCAPGETSWSSPWVGIDGDNSNTVEQIGTDSDCNSGTPYYYAWYEMYPKSLVKLPWAPSPGDSLTGSVTYNTRATSFTLALTDNTTGKTYTTTQSSRKAARSSVEWIVEGPSSGTLSDFGSLTFSGASAAFGGATAQPIGSLPGYTPITMVTKQGADRAVPSSLTSNGSAFTDTWQSG
jgi:hypothetical protein